jgi:uridine monophosphate synthetase
VEHVVVLIDREQGGAAHLAAHGLHLHAAFTLSFIVDTLLEAGLLSSEIVATVKQFVAENQTTAAVAGTSVGKLTNVISMMTVMFSWHLSPRPASRLW